MKPVSYQSMPSSVSGGHPSLALCLSNVMYCDKCDFASTDAAAFKKHMLEHLGGRFYCFYCNSVSFSEAELNAHLKQHTAKYPFKCPHCGQGYMRRLCLVKHIERLHSKSINQAPAKPGMTKPIHVPVSTTLSSVPRANPSPPRPAVRVTVPPPSATALRLGKDEQKGKTVASNVSNVTNRNAEPSAPLNGLIQHNRALTVSLPEEVTIPAGCLVELVEVKTVNGTKELKLRLVTQQENESVIKDTRTTVSQSSALGKPLSSASNNPNTVNSQSMGMCTVNRKQSEKKTVNVERPTIVQGTTPKNITNQVSKEKVGFKRSSPEIINLDPNTVIPSKLSKCIINPVRDGNTGIRITPREPVNLNAAAPTVISPKVANRLTSNPHPDNMGTSVSLIPEHSKTIPSRRTSDTKSIPREVAVPVKLEPGEIVVRNNASSEIKRESVDLSQQSVKSASPTVNVSLSPEAQVRAPVVSVCKDNGAAGNPSFPAHRTLSDPLSVKPPVLSNRTNSKPVAWPRDVRSSERAKEKEPESFPVISSVFSLSQQTEEVQGSIQPLVMALRDIVMDKNNSTCSTTENHINLMNNTENMKEVSKKEYCATAPAKSISVTCDPMAEQTKDSVKVEEHDKGIQHPPEVTHNHVYIKEEISNTKTRNGSISSETIASDSSKEVELASEKASPVDVSPIADSLQPAAKIDHEIYPSKFPTVSLRRVQVGVWKKNKKGLKLRLSKYKTEVPMSSVTDCAVIYPMPLKVNQLVKRPGPYQPVVVLNHPKPRSPVQGPRADSVADTGASSMVPKCQILKMRLSKVMGQKYEVMGCTVRVFP